MHHIYYTIIEERASLNLNRLQDNVHIKMTPNRPVCLVRDVYHYPVYGFYVGSVRPYLFTRELVIPN